MYATQKFAIEKIYCSPSLDRQYSFKLVRVNKPAYPLRHSVRVYDIVKHLPTSNWHHVFILGNLSPNFLNLLTQDRDWFRDYWIKVSDDMVERNYILNFYNDKGEMYPRNHIYYMFLDEHSLIFALEFNESLKSFYDVNSFSYINIYSNYWFRTSEYNSLPVKNGIKYNFKFVTNNLEKVQLQNEINNYKAAGGDVFVYVNGLYTDNVNLNIPNNSYIEYVYDQSIVSKETYDIYNLRTFDSILDNKLKYLLFRPVNTTNSIQFFDDCEIYVSNKNVLVTTGLYYYVHRDYAFRNVTDKDYSLYTSFVNNMALELSNKVGGGIDDKVIVLYTRKSGIERSLIYSSMKLHELYKLPLDKQENVILSSIYGLNDYRAETLENSDYFKVSRATSLAELTPTLVNSALGYNGITYYFANTPDYNINDTSIQVPLVYQEPSTAFEYDIDGKFIGHYTTIGPIYTKNSYNCKYVEFLYGQTPINFGKLYTNNETIDISENNSEFVVIKALFNGVERISSWENITNNPSYCTITNNTIHLNLSSMEKAKVIFFNQPLVYNLSLPFVDGILYFPLTITEDRGTGLNTFPLDHYYTNIEIYMNGYKLVPGLDYFMKFPYICITTKQYIDYNSSTQNLHIRCYGFTLNKEDINNTEKTGFVSHGVLMRNKKVDLFDDKVLSIYIAGKLYKRSLVRLAENDNTIRVNDVLNGLPYVVKSPFIPIKHISGGNTLELRSSNMEKDKRIENFYDQVYPESILDATMAVVDHYYLYSPLTTKIVANMLNGNISSSLYTNPYNDNDIHNLLNQSPYKELLELDPIKNLDFSKHIIENVIEIHPTTSNTTIPLNLYQYRFLMNVVRIITNNHPERIDLSGHFTVTT